MVIGMKEYFRHFRFLYIAFGVVVALAVFVQVSKRIEEGAASVRRNTECTTDERVFDYADVLTDEQEDKLREQIAEREKQIQADIVLVTLNESLKEYARSYYEDAPYSEFTMIYADNFYDEHKFGYNKPVGDGILLLDNIYREDDGKVYTWLCTTGKVEDKYSSSMIDRILDVFYENVDTNPYLAYKTFVDNVYYDMSGGKINIDVPIYIPFVWAAIIAAVYVVINLSTRKGRKTTNTRSYVIGGQPKLKRKEDIFIRKSVTSRTIETSSGGGGHSGGGGGGHHTSSGGHSHGGGGHSR